MGIRRGRGVGRAAAGLVIAAAILMLAVSPASAAPKGSIGGTILDYTSAPLAGVQVDVMNATYGNVVGTATTDGTGHYTVANLNPNLYRVKFTSPDNSNATMWSGGLTWSLAAKRAVVANTTTTVDQTLAQATQVAGTVTAGTTGIPGMAAVVLAQTLPYEAVGAALTAADGSYAVPKLVPADYKVVFIDPAFLNLATQHNSMRPEMFDDLDIVTQSLATAFANATLVPGSPGSTATADASLRGLDCTFPAGTNLNGQDLTAANLKGCALAGSDLGSANLTDANLHWATGTPANIAGAVWSNTTCPDGTNSDDPGNGGACDFPPVVTGDPPDGGFETPYSFTFTVASASSYTSSVISGALPAGLSLVNDAITGTPSAMGDAAGVIRFTNAAGDTDVPFAISVGKGNQTVVFDAMPHVWAGGPDATVGATTDATGPITFSLGPATTGFACSLTGTTLSFASDGVCEVVATNAGDSNWNPVSQSLLLNVDFNVGTDCAAVVAAGPNHAGDVLSGADLHNCWLNSFDFSSAQVDGANFYGAVLNSANFSNAFAVGTNFAFASMPYTSFGGATVVNATFSNAAAYQTYMLNAVLTGTEGTHIGGVFIFNLNTICADGVQAIIYGGTCTGHGYGW